MSKTNIKKHVFTVKTFKSKKEGRLKNNQEIFWDIKTINKNDAMWIADALLQIGHKFSHCISTGRTYYQYRNEEKQLWNDSLIGEIEDSFWNYFYSTNSNKPGERLCPNFQPMGLPFSEILPRYTQSKKYLTNEPLSFSKFIADEVVWDGVERISEFLESIWKFENPTASHIDYIRAVSKMLFIKPLYEIYTHYERPDLRSRSFIPFMPIFSGVQNCGKDSVADYLHQIHGEKNGQCPPVDLSGLSGYGSEKKDFYGQFLKGNVIYHASECDNLAKASVSAIKNFLSTSEIMYRPPYSRDEKIFKNYGFIIGSTNSREILNDLSGERRRFPIIIDTVNPFSDEYYEYSRMPNGKDYDKSKDIISFLLDKYPDSNMLWAEAMYYIMKKEVKSIYTNLVNLLIDSDVIAVTSTENSLQEYITGILKDITFDTDDSDIDESDRDLLFGNKTKDISPLLHIDEENKLYFTKANLKRFINNCVYADEKENFTNQHRDTTLKSIGFSKDVEVDFSKNKTSPIKRARVYRIIEKTEQKPYTKFKDTDNFKLMEQNPPH